MFEGEQPMAKDNHLIHKFRISGIRPAKSGVPKIKINFFVDENSILSVKAVNDKTGSYGDIIVTKINDKEKDEERKRMIEDAIRY